MGANMTRKEIIQWAIDAHVMIGESNNEGKDEGKSLLGALIEILRKEEAAESKPDYIYSWGNNSKRETMKGRKCRILARGKMNSILIEFTDNGQREITSRYAVRKIQNGN